MNGKTIMNIRYKLIILLLFLFLISSITFNFVLKGIIDEKTQEVEGCRHEFEWANRMLREIK